MRETLDKPATSPTTDVPVQVGEYEIKVLKFRGLITQKNYVIKDVTENTDFILLQRGNFPRKKAKETTIEVNCKHAILKFRILDAKGKVGRYHPVGIGFSRADKTEPIGVRFTTGASLLSASPVDGCPFYAVKLNEGDYPIEFADDPIKDVYSIVAAKPKRPRTHITYKFVVFIQETATGRYGRIDPEIENSNLL